MSRLQKGIAALVVCASLGWAVPAHADAVTYWNDITVRAVTMGRPGAVGFLDVALVQAAVHDAVQAFERRFQPYHAWIKEASGSEAAAVAAAARDTLVGLYPAQQAAIDADYQSFLTTSGLEGNPGLVVGQQAAAALLTQYRGAPNPPLPPYVGAAKTGVWRPTPSYIGNQSSRAASVLAHGCSLPGVHQAVHAVPSLAIPPGTSATPQERALPPRL
jgi:hypothetical protein